MEQAHFIGVRDPHIVVCVGGCSVCNDERTQVSRVDKRSGIDDRVLRLSKYYADMAMCYSAYI